MTREFWAPCVEASRTSDRSAESAERAVSRTGGSQPNGGTLTEAEIQELREWAEFGVMGPTRRTLLVKLLDEYEAQNGQEATRQKAVQEATEALTSARKLLAGLILETDQQLHKLEVS